MKNTHLFTDSHILLQVALRVALLCTIPKINIFLDLAREPLSAPIK